MSTLTVSRYVMPSASLGAPDPLPDLLHTNDVHSDIAVDRTTVSEEEARWIGAGEVKSILPYTLQNNYGRDRRKRAHKCFILENEHLKAVFLPGLGGRLWSLFDKDAGRELLHVNPVFQPANLALRNAWFSGGVEWNCGIKGHTPFTADDVACETLALSDGTPLLRMYQYERVRGLLYRVEAFLPDGARELYVRVRIDNTRDRDTWVYWWSNMAVNEREDVRVIVPAHKAFRFGYGGMMAKVAVPYMTAEADKLKGAARKLAYENGGTLDWDVSRTTGLPQAMDFFFDIPDGTRPFIAAIGADGYGMCQTSTAALKGRKLFLWGMGPGGRHWQSFLSRRGSQYLEIQSGLARTQLEHLPMKAGASVDWLESYGAVSVDPALAQGADWDSAVGTVAGALDASRPLSRLNNLLDTVRREIDGKQGTPVHYANGSAILEKRLLGKAFDTKGLSLRAMRVRRSESAWNELVRGRAFPCPDPSGAPLSYQISPKWEEKLRASLAIPGGDHWASRYHLAVMAAARGDTDAAKREYEASLARTENAWALRGLALIASVAGETEKCCELYERALRLMPIRSIACEALEALSGAGRQEEMFRLSQELPERVRRDGRVRTLLIGACLDTGRAGEAKKLFDEGVTLTDVREGNVILTDLWFRLQAILAWGSDSEENVSRARDTFTPPEKIDFRMN